MAVYHIRHTGSARSPSNLRQSTVELADGISLGELLDYVLANTTILGSVGEYADRKVTDTFFILINGRNCELSGCANARLKDGDTISLLVPVAGG
jgi:molybdopterin converting factor small subunit